MGFGIRAGTALAVAFVTVPIAASSQTPPDQGGGAQPDKPTGSFPTSPEQRTYWPKTDTYDPTQMIGRYIYITRDGQMDFATQRPKSVTGVATTKFQNAAPALTYDFKKKEEISVGVPGIASADFSNDSLVHLELSDISETTLDGSSAEFCSDWPKFRYIRSWAVGDKIVFVDHVLTSRARYQTAKMEQADAKLGIGSYFSAGGGMAKSTGTETNVPAMAIDGVPVTLDVQLIANGCPPGVAAAGLTKNVGRSGIGQVMTRPAAVQAKIASF